MKIKPLVGDFIETARQVSSYLFLGSIAFGLATEDSLLWIPSFITAAGLNIFGNEKQMNFSKIKIKSKEYPTSITILARVSEDSFIVEKDRDVPIFKTFQNHDLYGQVKAIAEKELHIYNTNVSHEDIIKEGLITINGETTYNYLFLIDDFTLDKKKGIFCGYIKYSFKKT